MTGTLNDTRSFARLGRETEVPADDPTGDLAADYDERPGGSKDAGAMLHRIIARDTVTSPYFFCVWYGVEESAPKRSDIHDQDTLP